MRRRTFLGAGATLAGATLARLAIVRAQSATTLKFIPYADLALLDPAVSAFITRNHMMMVFDSLFAMDAQGRAQPSMLEGFTTEPDGLTWTLTLRPCLKFHAGRSTTPTARRSPPPRAACCISVGNGGMHLPLHIQIS